MAIDMFVSLSLI